MLLINVTFYGLQLKIPFVSTSGCHSNVLHQGVVLFELFIKRNVFIFFIFIFVLFQLGFFLKNPEVLNLEILQHAQNEYFPYSNHSIQTPCDI